MKVISKGSACRICKNNKEGECVRGYTEPVYKTNECWAFQHKDENNALAQNGEINIEWRMS